MREPPPTACPRMEESHWTNPFAVLWWFRRILVSLLETNSRFRNEVGTPAHCWWSKNLWYWLWSVDDFHRTEVSGTSTASGHEIAAFSDGVDFFINPFQAKTPNCQVDSLINFELKNEQPIISQDVALLEIPIQVSHGQGMMQLMVLDGPTPFGPRKCYRIRIVRL